MGHFVIVVPCQWVYAYQFCSQTLVLRAASASYRMGPAQSTLSCLCWPSGPDVVFHMDIQWWPPWVPVTIVNSNDDSDASRDFHPQKQWSLPNVCSLQMRSNRDGKISAVSWRFRSSGNTYIIPKRAKGSSKNWIERKQMVYSTYIAENFG